MCIGSDHFLNVRQSVSLTIPGNDQEDQHNRYDRNYPLDDLFAFHSACCLRRLRIP